MNFFKRIVRVLFIGVAVAVGTVFAAFMLAIGLVVLLVGMITGKQAKFQVFTNRPQSGGFNPQMRDVTPSDMFIHRDSDKISVIDVTSANSSQT